MDPSPGTRCGPRELLTRGWDRRVGMGRADGGPQLETYRSQADTISVLHVRQRALSNAPLKT